MIKLAETVAKYPWFHSIELPDGVVTPGIKSTEIMRLEADAIFGPVAIENSSVIDIGTWNGGFSVEAKRRGARRVLATDHFTWRDPFFRGRETFDLVRSTLNVDVEALELDVTDHSVESVGKFDVVMFLGVFYHLFDPIHALTKVADIASEVLVVESHIDLVNEARPAMVFYPGDECFGDATNWWGPNPQLLQELLPKLGFPIVDCRISPIGQRVIAHAWRSSRLRRAGEAPAARYERKPLQQWDVWRQRLSRALGQRD